jgi:hypothetical protein
MERRMLIYEEARREAPSSSDCALVEIAGGGGPRIRKYGGRRGDVRFDLRAFWAAVHTSIFIPPLNTQSLL